MQETHDTYFLVQSQIKHLGPLSSRNGQRLPSGRDLGIPPKLQLNQGPKLSGFGLCCFLMLAKVDFLIDPSTLPQGMMPIQRSQPRPTMQILPTIATKSLPGNQPAAPAASIASDPAPLQRLRAIWMVPTKWRSLSPVTKKTKTCSCQRKVGKKAIVRVLDL